jgi:hypothetical protein
MAKFLRGAIWLPLCFFSLSCSGAGMNLFTSKFEYQASESAPKKNVMRILAGSLSSDDGSLYIPNMSDIDNGWGTGASSHVVGPDRKPLPKRLDVAFFSYLENQFYRGHFDLPYDKVLKLFKEGHYSPKEDKHITYHKFVVGVAPGGAVAVWLVSMDKTTEVFFGQAEKVEEDWRAMTDNSMPRKEYVRQVTQESLKTPEAIAALHKNGPPIGLWSRYRTRYSWQPVFTGITLENGRISTIMYFNGERDYLDYPLDKINAASTRAVPSEIHFVWEHTKATKDTKATGTVFRLFFDEADQPLQLELRMEVANGKKSFTIWLRNDKESTQLKRTLVKNFVA